MTYLLLSTLLLCADWGQTNYIVSSPDYHESNPLLGENPTRKQVSRHFVTAIALNTGIGFMLPKQYRKYFWGGVALTELHYVTHNYMIGIKVRM